MTRVSLFSSPLLLGFDEVERLIDRASKTPGDGYPPYNIERFADPGGRGEALRITLALAGFTAQDLEITVEDNQLLIRGRQSESNGVEYLHRGIAARQFSRSFVLADGMEVREARLANGLLSISLTRIIPEKSVRRIPVVEA